MTRKDDVLLFLDSVHNPESVDPLHKWIRTNNLYRVFLMQFFKWFYYPDLAPNARPKPHVIENIDRLKRRDIHLQTYGFGKNLDKAYLIMIIFDRIRISLPKISRFPPSHYTPAGMRL
ncbi:MAG: hypothetical protein WAM14_00930 [Candidatus Nitrosopolaris sp.]